VVEQAEVVDAVARGGGKGGCRHTEQAGQEPAERRFHKGFQRKRSLIIAHVARRGRGRGGRREPIIAPPMLACADASGLYPWRKRYRRINRSGKLHRHGYSDWYPYTVAYTRIGGIATLACSRPERQGFIMTSTSELCGLHPSELR
jgi:hypothetical protein